MKMQFNCISDSWGEGPLTIDHGPLTKDEC